MLTHHRLKVYEKALALGAGAAELSASWGRRIFALVQRSISWFAERVPTESAIAENALTTGRFSTTRWSTVALANDPSSPGACSALERLCQDYWPPLFAYALRQGRDFHSAQDFTQSFFSHFIERGYLRAADRTRGRFRTFLLTCFQHFLSHEWEKKRTAKRGGQFALVSWEEQSLAVEERAASSLESPPERQYDREWALAMMERALIRLRATYEKAGQTEVLAVLERFLHCDPAPGEYLQAANHLEVPERAVRVAVHRMRRKYGRLVRDEVQETVANEEDVDDEMRYLVELVSA